MDNTPHDTPDESAGSVPVTTYTLTAADGSTYQSPTKGEYGGNRRQQVYGTMGCGVARDQLRRFPETMRAHRVFFADEATAIAAGYRPCGSCQREKYLAWKAQSPD